MNKSPVCLTISECNNEKPMFLVREEIRTSTSPKFVAKNSICLGYRAYFHKNITNYI